MEKEKEEDYWEEGNKTGADEQKAKEEKENNGG